MPEHPTPCPDLTRLEKRVDKLGDKYDELKDDFIDFRATANHEATTVRTRVVENTNDIKALREQLSEVKVKIAKMAVIVSMATAIITAALVLLARSVVGS